MLIAVGMALIVDSLHHGHSYAADILPGWIILGTGLGCKCPKCSSSPDTP